MKKIFFTTSLILFLGYLSDAQEKVESNSFDQRTTTVLKQKNPQVVEEYIVVDQSMITTQKSQNPFYKKEEGESQIITTEKKQAFKKDK